MTKSQSLCPGSRHKPLVEEKELMKEKEAEAQVLLYPGSENARATRTFVPCQNLLNKDIAGEKCNSVLHQNGPAFCFGVFLLPLTVVRKKRRELCLSLWSERNKKISFSLPWNETKEYLC